MKKFYLRLLFPALFLFAVQFPVCAQLTNAFISGKITDTHQLPVPSASIKVSGTRYGTLTDEKGYYYLKLPAGRYQLSVQAVGFVQTQTTANLQAGQHSDISLQLVPEVQLMQEVAITGVKVKSAAATRTLLNLQDIPQAVSVIGQKDIKQQAAFDLTTITRNISGLNFTGNYSGAGSSQFFNARGFDLNDAQNYRWNGMMIWNWGNNYADNIEQVEFLKGPTSILYGDVAPGGVLNFVTKKPLPEFMAEVNFKTGSWGLARPAVDITGPLTKSANLRYRLNTSFEYQRSFREYVSSRKAFIAPALAWDISSKLTMTAEAVFNRSSATDDAGLVSLDGSISGLKMLLPTLYLGEPSRRYEYRNQSYTAGLNYQISKAWRAKLAGFYAYTSNRPFGIWFGQPDSAGNFARNGYGFYQYAHNGTVTAEVNGTFYTGAVKHHLLFGAEYQSMHQRYTNAGGLSAFDTSSIDQPVYGHVVPNPPASPLQPLVSIIERRGIFLQDQAMLFNERLQLLFGIRIGSTRQGNHYYQDQLPGTDYAGYIDQMIGKTIYTPRLGAVYKMSGQASLYASYSKGYEINSPDIFAQNFRDYLTPPATISQQLEFGVKTNLAHDRLGVMLSIFEINKHNPYGYVYLDPVHPDYDQYNIYYEGHHRSRGIELEANGYVLPQLSVTAAMAYTVTRVMADPGYPAGNMLPNAPKYTANMWLNYAPEKLLRGLTFGSGIFYKDKFFSSVANNPLLEIPAGYTLDAAVGYNGKHAGIQLNVRNLTNRVAYLNPWQFDLFDVQPLRQFILTLTCKIGKARP